MNKIIKGVSYSERDVKRLFKPKKEVKKKSYQKRVEEKLEKK